MLRSNFLILAILGGGVSGFLGSWQFDDDDVLVTEEDGKVRFRSGGCRPTLTQTAVLRSATFDVPQDNGTLQAGEGFMGATYADGWRTIIFRSGNIALDGTALILNLTFEDNTPAPYTRVVKLVNVRGTRV